MSHSHTAPLTPRLAWRRAHHAARPCSWWDNKPVFAGICELCAGVVPPPLRRVAHDILSARGPWETWWAENYCFRCRRIHHGQDPRQRCRLDPLEVWTDPRNPPVVMLARLYTKREPRNFTDVDREMTRHYLSMAIDHGEATG